MSEAEVPNPDVIPFGGAVPIFRIQHLAASIGYYVQVLGFKLDWQTPGFASVSRGRCCVFLSEGDQGNPGAWVWIGVPDAEALFEHYRATCARVRHPPANYPWALELHIEDLDGNVLRLGSDSKKDQPFGEWLNMRGQRWVMSPGGGWTKVESA